MSADSGHVEGPNVGGVPVVKRPVEVMIAGLPGVVLVLAPGDRVIVGMKQHLSPLRRDEMRRAIAERVPDLTDRVLVIEGAEWLRPDDGYWEVAAEAERRAEGLRSLLGDVDRWMREELHHGLDNDHVLSGQGIFNPVPGVRSSNVDAVLERLAKDPRLAL